MLTSNTSLLVGILIIIAVVLTFVLYVLATSRKDLGKAVELTVGVTDALTAVARQFDKDPLHNSPFDKVVWWVNNGVHAAEQLYKSAQLPPDQRKAYVVEYVKMLANQHGIDWTPELEQHVGTIIETVVQSLPKDGKTITLEDIKNIMVHHPDLLMEALKAVQEAQAAQPQVTAPTPAPAPDPVQG